MHGPADAVSDCVDPGNVVLEMPIPAKDEEYDDCKERDGDDDAYDDGRQDDVGQPSGGQRWDDRDALGG